MMMHRTSILSVTSLAIALLFASFLHVETARLRRAIRAIEFESPAPKLEVEPPSKQSSAGGTTAARVVGRLRRGLGVTSTTTATTMSITTTTTMVEGRDMSPSDFYVLHHREHGLALAEEAAAASLEDNYDEDEEERELRQRRRRRRRRRRQLTDIVKRQQEEREEEEEVDETESGQVEQQLETAEKSASPTDDGDGHDDDDNSSVIAGASPPSSNPHSAVDGSDVSVNITDDCDVDYPEDIGDGNCYRVDEYNTAECGWDGGDCCYQTCRDGIESWQRCGYYGYDCRDPRFTVYDEEGERDPQRRRERQALRALYDATNGDGWDYQGRWHNDTLDHCYWDRRIGCTAGEGYVRSIYIWGNNLIGSLPSDIGDLVHLEGLGLGGKMSLSGSIPASIGKLTKLTRLDVSNTSLSGPVPANVMTLIFSSPGQYYSPDNTRDYAELSPLNCADVVGWTDADGHGCDSYANDTSSCPTDGAPLGDMGHAADTACCACGLYGRYDREGEVLEELYDATNGGGWNNSSFWTNSSTSHCYYWTGVRCNRDGMVTNITLPSNNLSGSLPTSIGELRSLQILDVSDNNLGGTVPITQLASLTLLRRLDLSHNGLTGPIPVDIMDLSLVEDLLLSHNQLTGTLSPEFRRMSRLKRLDLDSNRLEGSIPVDIGLLSLLREFRLSNQRGYWDSVTVDWKESLTGPIPVELGDCQYLEVLDLSGNRLSGVLPTELARLTRMKSLLLHDNRFEGHIPSEYGLLPSLENLLLGVYQSWSGQDEKKRKPAPLSLCFNGAFDLHSDPSWCPPERNALKRLYDATGGDGWSNRGNWTDPYGNYCSWYGVGCNVHVSCRDVHNWTDSLDRGCDWYGLHPDNYCKENGDYFKNNNHTANTACCVCQQEALGCFWNGTECRGQVTSLSLISNGLSGPLPAELFQLDELEDLRLGNNRLVGTLPEMVGKKLKVLQLSGNDFSGNIPSSFKTLTKLSILHLHGNRFTSGIPADVTASLNMTADCGDPYYYRDEKLSCENCDICCNSEGKCMEQVKEPLGLPQKTGLFMGCMIAFLLIFCAIVFTLNNFVDLPLPKRSAMDYCGESSVYSFFLAKSCRGWILTFATVAAQVGIFTMFLSAANIDNENSDWEYYMRCPPNQLWCESDDTVDYKGWLIFGLLMVAFLGKDVISGIMLMYAAGLRTNFFCFVSGSFISVVTGYAVWTSVQYNLAIATSNTALVSNAVIILFVNDLDERMFALSGWLFPGWVAGVTQKSNVRSADICSERSTTQELIGSTSKIADMGSAADEQSDKEGETSVSCGEDLHALFTKQNETIEELRAQIKALKTAFELQTSNGKLNRKLSENPESTSDDDD